MIICAGNNETFKFAKAMGVGLVESAINMTRQCLFDKPEYILFIGSAGSYGNHKIFDIIESNTAANLELSFLENNSYTPLDNVLKSDNKLVEQKYHLLLQFLIMNLPLGLGKLFRQLLN